MQPLTVGTKVRWTSQSRGSTTTKEGVVVVVRPSSASQHYLKPRYIAGNSFPNHRRMFDGNIWLGPHGVLVEVRDGKTSRAAPKLYMPFPDKLEPIQ